MLKLSFEITINYIIKYIQIEKKVILNSENISKCYCFAVGLLWIK